MKAGGINNMSLITIVLSNTTLQLSLQRLTLTMHYSWLSELDDKATLVNISASLEMTWIKPEDSEVYLFPSEQDVDRCHILCHHTHHNHHHTHHSHRNHHHSQAQIQLCEALSWHKEVPTTKAVWAMHMASIKYKLGMVHPVIPIKEPWIPPPAK